MKKIFVAIILSFFLSSAAWAISLPDAKAQKLVGETPSGYLEAVSGSPSADVKALVDDINSKRRDEYKKIADKNKTKIAAVEALAGSKAIEKTPAGQYVKKGGNWVVK
ncbi:MAG: YdbL family protein [Bdellovibrionales bacterium]|nr:YdbL family protein [Bdellovibrionales bacterium]